MERLPELLYIRTAQEDSRLVDCLPLPGLYHRQRHAPTAAPACLLTLKPAFTAVVFPALLLSFLTGANRPDRERKYMGYIAHPNDFL